MITGLVNSRLEAVLQLEVFDKSGVANQVSAIVDTGFGGYLTLPVSAVRSYELRSLGRHPGMLADGSRVFFDVYAGEVVWDGHKQRVEIHSADAEPLLGMALLNGHELKIEVRTGGSVEIEKTQ